MSRLSMLALGVLVGVSAGVEGGEEPVMDRLVEAHNRIRARRDLPELKVNAKLEEAARVHARDMAEHEMLAHEGSDGSTPAQRVERQGYLYLLTGENVAEGQEDVTEVMDDWMKSPHHRRNILGDFKEIGAARAEDAEGRFYWVVEFGRAIPRLDPKEAAGEVVERINREREKAGKEALRVSAKLAEAAETAARDMAENDTLRRKDGGSVAFEEVRREGYAYREIRQNTASGQATAEKLVESLMESEKREESVLGGHEEIGVGYAQAKDGTPYWVVLLGTPREGD